MDHVSRSSKRFYTNIYTDEVDGSSESKKIKLNKNSYKVTVADGNTNNHGDGAKKAAANFFCGSNSGSTSEIRQILSAKSFVSGNKDNKKNNAAIKIQKYYREFRVRKSSTPVNELGAKVMINEKSQINFYFPQSDQLNIKPYFRTPHNEVENGIEGKYKKITRSDSSFVQLNNKSNSNDPVAAAKDSSFVQLNDKSNSNDPVVAAKDSSFVQLNDKSNSNDPVAAAKDSSFVQLNDKSNSNDPVAAAKQANELAAELSKYSSICRFFYVDRNTLLAENGGKDLFERVFDKEMCSLNMFKKACEELEEMHKEGIFLRDIKLENMVAKGTGNADSARHIDHDFIVTPNYGDYRRSCCTTVMITAELLSKRKSKNLGRVKRALKASDYLAMLLTIMSAVNQELKIITCNVKSSKVGVELTSYHNECLDTIIKPEHQKEVRRFLQRPAKNRLSAPLHKMFKWSNESHNDVPCQNDMR